MGKHTLNALTVKKIEASKAAKLRDGGGLWLVTKGAHRYWIWDHTFGGKRRQMGLGPLHTVGLGEARDKAEAARKLLRTGVDPIAQRAADTPSPAAGVKTFGPYADAYIDAAVKAKRWRGAKTEDNWRKWLTDHATKIRDKALADIGVTEVLSVVRPLWGAKQETAEKVREAIERVLDAAKVEGLRSGDNPAAWRGNLEHVLHKPGEGTRGHHEALPYEKAPAFMKRLRGADTPIARALEFLILTATRSAEARLAVWTEFDLDAALWTIPAARMKEHRIHRVPLSGRAVEIVKAMQKQSLGEYVFPGKIDGRPISEFRRIIEDCRGGDATAHGFRSTFKDWCSEETSFEWWLSEAALAHAVGDQTERAYKRGDALKKRRELMEAWAAYCGAK
ncbi:integrase [Bradyrhizobium sp. JR6.1]